MSKGLLTKVTVPSNTAPNISGSHKYKGFSTVNTSTENFSLYDFELIKQDLLNHFYVKQGERLMNPAFGTIIWDLLFEPLTEDVKYIILQNVNEIVNHDPRVQASNVIVTGYDTGIRIEVTLTYLQYNLSERLQIQFDQRNGMTV
jgi:phage baseplate assembly protein W